MMIFEWLMIGLLVSSLVGYGLTKINPELGAIWTIVVSLMTLGVLTLDVEVHTSIFPWLSFEVTALGQFFVLIIVFIYAMVSFFHPYYVASHRFPASYHFLFLLSLFGVIGAFYSTHLIQIFFFFELIVWSTMFLIPMGKSKDAAIMYFGFGALGSLTMLFGILYTYQATQVWTLEALRMLNNQQSVVVFISFLVAGISKLGAFPLHLWLPVAHGNAPHAFSPVLSGGLVKLGAFISILALVYLAPFSDNWSLTNIPLAQYIVLVIGAITIVFGTLMAIKEDDAKKLLAYSSMSHGGYILVAFSLMNHVGIAGGFYHIFAHAMASAAAFMAIGAVAKQTHTTKMKELGGIIHKMPITFIVYLSAIISMAGIPPMGGFISKWLIFQAVMNEGLIFIAGAVFFGSIGSFLYVFRPLAALFLGQELNEFKEQVKEAPFWMLVPMLILTLIHLYSGILPTQILMFINTILVELDYETIVISQYTISGQNGVLHPLLIALVFGVGILLSSILFFSLKKAKKVSLMDTFTAGNFVYDPQLIHYSMDFYAPLERLYEPHSHYIERAYERLTVKLKELGRLSKYVFMSHLVEVGVFFMVTLIIFILWGEIR